MCIENFNTLMKEIKGNINRYSMYLGRKNQYFENDYTAKCSQLSAIPVKLPMAFFIELEQNISQFI